MQRIRRRGVLMAAIGFSLYATGASAAHRSNLYQEDLGQLRANYQGVVGALGLADMAHTRHERFLGVDADTYLVMLAKHGEHGMTNYRYRQTWQGVPVYGDTVVVSEDGAGNVRRLFGSLVRDIKLPTIVPAISRDEALASAKDAWLGKYAPMYRYENAKQELVVYLARGNSARLAYAIEFFADTAVGTPTRPIVIIDATNGRVLEKRENLQTSEPTGTGPGGNVKTGLYGYGAAEVNGVAVYDYLDITRAGTTCSLQNDRVRTFNMNNTTTTATQVSYACASAPFRFDESDINGAYAPINDAHHFGSVSFDMYQAYVGSSPLTIQLQQRVHYSSNYENAFWNGTGMTYGDGASTFYPLVSLDVTSHEISHGYSEQNSGLSYAGQSGGINESFSDMGGEAAEYFDRGSADFKVGYDIMKSANAALRYMYNPPLDGRSIGNAANYTNGMDVHYSSGVYNKAFYLLASNGALAVPSTTGANWGIPNAFRAFARANRDYWTAGTDYNVGACGVEAAAADLGYSVADVTASFAKVGVACPTAATITQIFDATPVTGISGASASRKYYYIDVPAGQTQLVVTTTGPGGTENGSNSNDVGLYVKAGGMPSTTTGDYDCAPQIDRKNNETCTFNMPLQGRYYVMLYGAAAYSDVTLTGDYSSAGYPAITTLTKAVGTSTGTIPSGTNKYYKFTVPSGAVNLSFRLVHGTGDADAYISRDPLPSTSVYQFAAAAGGDAADELTTVNWPQAGDYYIAVNAWRKDTNPGKYIQDVVNFTITADYQLDTSAPTVVALEATTADGTNGWYKAGNAVVTYACNDSGGSYVTDCPEQTVFSADGVSQSPAWVVHDGFGNVSAPSNQVQIKVDKTRPTISAAVSTPQSTPGWYNTAVLVQFTCADATSGVVRCPNKYWLATEGLNQQSRPYQVVDQAGNLSVAANLVSVNIDLTKPAVSAAPTTSPNANGWYTGDVTIHYTCSDALSGLASCPANAVMTGRGAAVPVVAGVATDVAGNQGTNAAATLKIDSTAPVLAPSLNPGATVSQGAALTASANASDGESGILSQGCDAADTSTVGSKTLTCRATNGAGMETTQLVSYEVVP